MWKVAPEWMPCPPNAIIREVAPVRRTPFPPAALIFLLPAEVGPEIPSPTAFILRLVAVAAVLAVGDFLAQAIAAWIFSRGQAEGFTLHFGQFLFIIVIGTVVSIWWGWRSTAIVVLVDGVWQMLAAVLERRLFDRLPPGEE
jgi:hypothetical protein